MNFRTDKSTGLFIDLRNALCSPRTDNFTCLLMRLMLKADQDNFQKLSSAYPEVGEIIQLWKSAEITLSDLW